jgi:GT2 family glycosyltransferase
MVNPLFCLQSQVKHLLKYKHKLDQITFVVNGDIPNGYYETIKPLKEKHRTVTINRENIGLSYGGFAEAASTYIEEFDFFIFLEDDWVFCHDNFDRYILEKFEKHKNTSMVCAVSSETDLRSERSHGKHASVSIYGSSKEKIKELIKKHGLFPYSMDGYGSGQQFQTNLFFHIGKVVDITDDFFVRFLDVRGEQSWGDSKNKELVKQLDFVD